jgi:hypothetical protein
MPQIRRVGITPEGAVWVIADKGENRTPEGHSFHGFAGIEDDLGREYRRVYYSHETMSDRSKDVYVPLGYPFDANVPSKITLSCRMDKYEARGREPLIGTVVLTEWEQDKYWPKGTIDATAESLAKTMAWRHATGKRYAMAERILATIEGEPGENSAALGRELIRLRILVKQEKYEEAVAFGKALVPAMEADYRRWKGYAPHVTIFGDYMVALACTKRLEEIKELWGRLEAIKPEIPDSLNKRARQIIEKDMKRYFENAARKVIPYLSREARLTVEQINELLGLDIKNDETYRHLGYWDWNPEYEKPRYKNWQRRLEELAEYYKTHPLPERMEIIKRDKDEEMATRLTRMPGIDTHYALPLRRKFRDYVYFYKYPESAGRLRMEDGLAEMKCQHDIVCKAGIKQPERIAFVLEHFGLEVVEVNEPRRVWVAKYDGRKLKDYKEVKAPGKMMAMNSDGLNLDYLFRSFMDHQNRDVKAAGPIIVDETGITEKVALECPNFEGAKGLETARKWFAEEMGITFIEQVRPMTTYVIRKQR